MMYDETLESLVIRPTIGLKEYYDVSRDLKGHVIGCVTCLRESCDVTGLGESRGGMYHET